MTDEQLYAHAKQQEPQVQSVLSNLADAMLELDMVHEDGRCTAAYIDYDEQDMLNAATIMYSVCGNYAIKHGLLNEYNTEEKINAFREMVKETFGLDTIQEMQVSIMLSQIKNALREKK